MTGPVVGLRLKDEALHVRKSIDVENPVEVIAFVLVQGKEREGWQHLKIVEYEVRIKD